MRKRILLFTLGVGISMACTFADLSGYLIATQIPVTPISEEVRLVIETSEVETPMVESPTSAPTATEVIDKVCVQPAAHEPLPTTTFQNYPNVILNYLIAGATLEELITSLDELGISNPPTAAASADLTGDNKNDVIISFVDLESQTVPYAGALLIYTCQDDLFVLTHIELSQEYLGAPAIIYIQDLNADGKDDLIISSSTCGAHTCFEDTNILAWNGTSFDNRLDGSTDDLPFPNLQITDYDQDGVYDLEVVGGSFGSIGAGPQRDVTRIWVYDSEPGRWIPGEDSPGPSTYRIHILHDADQAFLRGEYQVALLLYSQVINDSGLKDWMNAVNEQANLGAYARFKVLAANAAHGDLLQAQEMLKVMSDIYPEYSVQRSYLEMAQIFLVGFGAGNLAGGCEAARLYIDTQASGILKPLGSEAFGYANPDYTAIDVCPG